MINEIVTMPNVYTLSTDVHKKTQLELMKLAFSRHYEFCHQFRKYCQVRGFSPDCLVSFEDINLIPLIPTLYFKEDKVISVSESEIFKTCLSSGTRGSKSTIYRDKITHELFYETMRRGSLEILGAEGRALILGPPPEEAQDLWIAYVLTLVGGYLPVKFMVKDGSFLYEDFTASISLDPEVPKIIIGPPFLILKLCRALQNSSHSLKLPPKSMVVTAGGWKRFSGEEISRQELEDIIHYTLGVEQHRITDALNLVELNTVIYECPFKRKHVPVWLRVCAKDPITLKEVRDQLGLLGYLDTTAQSYPGFILSDDLGYVVDDNPCECGITGQTIEIVRRVSSIEARGCALKIDRMLEEV